MRRSRAALRRAPSLPVEACDVFHRGRFVLFQPSMENPLAARSAGYQGGCGKITWAELASPFLLVCLSVSLPACLPACLCFVPYSPPFYAICVLPLGLPAHPSGSRRRVAMCVLSSALRLVCPALLLPVCVVLCVLCRVVVGGCHGGWVRVCGHSHRVGVGSIQLHAHARGCVHICARPCMHPRARAGASACAPRWLVRARVCLFHFSHVCLLFVLLFA